MADQDWKLVDEVTGREIKPGDRVKTFRGEEGTLAFFRPPHKPSSSGRIYVDLDNGSKQNEWFPSVIDAKIVRSEG